MKLITDPVVEWLANMLGSYSDAADLQSKGWDTIVEYMGRFSTGTELSWDKVQRHLTRILHTTRSNKKWHRIKCLRDI